MCRNRIVLKPEENNLTTGIPESNLIHSNLIRKKTREKDYFTYCFRKQKTYFKFFT
jgi:hypothetical protein